MDKIEYFLPIHTKTKDNQRGHWAGRNRVTKTERELSFWTLKENQASAPEFPVRVTLTRVGPRRLDAANLGSAFKAIIDGIADAYKVDDGDERWEFIFKQEKSSIYGVKVKIEAIRD